MRPETKVVLEEYKVRFKTYKDFLDKNDWVNDVKENEKGTLYSEKLNTEFAIVKSILESMDKFKADVGEDVTLKVVKDFIQSTVKIIKSHVAKIDKYEKQNPLSNNDTEGGNLEEFNFQTKLFQNKVKSKVALSKLNIDEEELSRKSVDLFYGNVKAPLMMRDYLYDKFDVVKNKTDALGIDFSVPHINPATSNELLINMKPKDIPPWDSTKHFFEQEKSTIQFWEEEKIKIRNGVNIGGYHLSGWLYWHTNIFKLNYGAEDEKDIKVALFRDNEYFFDYMYNKAKSPEYGRHGLFLYGTRRYSKSSGMSSRLLYGLWTIKNASATVQGFSKVPDLEALVNYSSDAIGEMYPALRIPANSFTLDDGIALGLKDKKAQNRLDFSKLSIVNLEGGNTKKGTQKTAGSTPDIFLLDECGKGKSIPPWKAAMPSFAGGKNGKWRLVPMLSGCVCAGTKVYDKKGNILNIEDVTKETGILGYNSESYSVENIPWIQPPKEKECVRITADYNKTLECSKDHPVMVYKNGNVFFKRAENIDKNDKIVFFNGIKPFGNKNIYHAELIGLMIGDGYYGSGCELSISDKSLYEYLKGKYYWHISDKEPDCLDPYCRRTNIKGLTHVLSYHGMYGDTKMDKKLPSDIQDWDEDSVARLLRGYFEADGYISKEVNRRRITLTSVSPNLVNDVRYQLEKFGIVSNVFKRVRNSNKRSIIKSNVNKKESFINGSEFCFTLEITRFEFIKKFAEKIGFISNYKKDRLANAIEGYKGKIKKIEIALFKDSLPGKGQYFADKKCTNISFINVKNTEDIGLKPIYNLEAGVTHTYITNGFISHNTAGEGALSQDAEAMLKDPKGYSIMPMDWDHLEEFVDPDYVTWERNNFGFFVPAQMSLEAPDKIIQPFGDFLNTGINTKKLDLTELNKLNIHVTDWKEAKAFFEQKRENVKNDLSLLAGETNSFPLTPEDCYVSSEKNKFPGLQAKKRRGFVEQNGLQGQKVWLVRNGDKIEAQQTNDPIITEYPYKGGNFDAPIVILDDPYDRDGNKPPLGLYCAGFDDVKQERSSGDSVMSCTIFKRSYEGGEWANRIVAYYDSRPDNKKDYYRNLYLLLKFYNARLLHENEDNGFVEYMEDNHMSEIHTHLSDGVGLATEESLHRNKNRKYGWSPTSLNIYRLEETMVIYTKEEGVKIGEEENLTGIDRINHPMLLEELYKYKKDLNADRIRSFGLALKLAKYYDNTYQYMKFRKKDLKEEETSFKKKKRTIGVKGFSFTNKLKKF